MPHRRHAAICYNGVSPVTAMTTHNSGVLTAFSNAGPLGYRVHWSADGNQLGSGPVFYEGAFKVIAMAPYKKGVLLAVAV